MVLSRWDMAIPDCVTLESLLNMLLWDLKKLTHIPRCQAQAGPYNDCTIISRMARKIGSYFPLAPVIFLERFHYIIWVLCFFLCAMMLETNNFAETVCAFCFAWSQSPSHNGQHGKVQLEYLDPSQDVLTCYQVNDDASAHKVGKLLPCLIHVFQGYPVPI